jgi:hypothetical protein
MFFMLWGALYSIFLSLWLFTNKKLSLIMAVILFTGFYFLFFLQNVFWINFTRPSLLATSSFIILLAGIYLAGEKLRTVVWLILFPAITYIFGHLTRLDAGHLGLAFGASVSIIFIFRNKPLLPFFTKCLSPVLVFVILVFLYNKFSQDKGDRNKDFLEKTELIRQLIDYRNAAAYVPRDRKDTIAYNAMINARYCSDNKVITTDFIRSLTNESPLLERADSKKFNDETGALFASLKGENLPVKMLEIGIAILILSWFLFSPSSRILVLSKFVLLQLALVCIVIFMSYFMKMPARVFQPLLVILSFSNLLFVLSFINFEKKQYRLLYIIPALLIFYSISAYSKANKSIISDYKRYGRVNHEIVNDMNQQFRNTVFIPTNLRSWEFHNATDPVREINFKNNNSYVYLSIELSLAPETQDQMMDKFKTTDHAKLFLNISSMDNVVFLSDDKYNNFLRSYYHYLYNQDYYFEPAVGGTPSFYQSTGLNYYRLKKMQ